MTKELNRRDFIKLSSGAAAVVGLSSIPGTLGALSNDQKLYHGSTKFVNSVCEMCTSKCSIEARVEEGKGVFIRGNQNDKGGGGHVCARGAAGFNQLYDPKRLVKPIMRAGERGEGKWKEVSWDEAYTFIAKKMDEIKQKHGAHTMAFTARSGWNKNFFHTLGKAYGSPNVFGHEATCPLAYHMAYKDVFGVGVDRDWANSKFVINMGHNLFEGLSMSKTAKYAKCLERGGKVVTFEPRLSVMAAKSAKWVPIKPGHDLPFVLAFINVLINENLYNKKFVEKYCEGFEELKASVAEYTPEKMAGECDVSAEFIRHIAREFAAAAPKAIFDFGHRVTFSPQELELRRAMMMINALVGNVDKKGGLYIGKNDSLYNKYLGVGDPKAPKISKLKIPPFPKVSFPRIDRIGEDDSQYFLAKSSEGAGTLVPQAALEELPNVGYKIHGWFIARNNPVMTMSDTNRTIKAMKAMDLVVVVDIQVSDTAWFADVVLPDTTYLERDEELQIAGSTKPVYKIGRQKVVEPIGDCRPGWRIGKELANKMGLGKYFPYQDIEDYRLQQVKGDVDMLAKLKLKGVTSFGVSLLTQEKSSVDAFVKKFPGAAVNLNDEGLFDLPKKIKLYSPKLAKVGLEGALSYKPFKIKEPDELYLINGKSAVRTNGAGGNNIWLNNLQKDGGAWIHPKTAAKFGIKTGDIIEIYNKRSAERGTAYVTLGVREDTVFAYMGFGHVSKDLRFHDIGINSSRLFSSFTSPGSGMNLHVAGIKVRKV